MKHLLAFSLGALHPSTRMRIAAYEPYLQELGWRVRMHHFDSGMGSVHNSRSPWRRPLRKAWLAAGATAALARWGKRDPILVSRELPLYAWPFWRSPQPLVLDIDDALYLGPGREQIERLCRRARAVVCGSDNLAAALSPHSNCCVVIPTVVDPARYRLCHDPGRAGPLRLGWIGTTMSVHHGLEPFLATLSALRRELDFELVTILDAPPPFLQNVPWIRFLRWSPQVEDSLAEHVDVGLMPLLDTPFQTAKCGGKLVQYMAAGLPAVVAPLGVNRSLCEHGVTGFWATSASDWREAIAHLAGDAALRAAMGRAARQKVEEAYSVARWANVWAALLEKITSCR